MTERELSRAIETTLTRHRGELDQNHIALDRAFFAELAAALRWEAIRLGLGAGLALALEALVREARIA
jgi:hypothetical protein